MDTTTTLRIVPGAPPPTPLTKSQKKKRQTKRKIADSSVESSLQTLSIDNNQNGVVESEVKEGSSPQVDSVSLQEQKAQSLDVQLKPSPIVDLVHKRLKVTTKKIVRTKLHFLLYKSNQSLDGHWETTGTRFPS